MAAGCRHDGKWVTLMIATHAALGLSLGLLYNYTYFGRAAVLLPEPTAAYGPVLYYIALAPLLDAPSQALLWLLCCPLAGLLWLAGGWLVARPLGGSPRAAELARPAVAGALPMLLPLPWLAWLHAVGPDGASWSLLVDRCLYRGFDSVPAGLNPLYLALGAVGGLLELALLWRVDALPRRRFVVWLFVSLFVAALMVSLLGLGIDAVLEAMVRV